jgi:hypothetical protein
LPDLTQLVMIASAVVVGEFALAVAVGRLIGRSVRLQSVPAHPPAGDPRWN